MTTVSNARIASDDVPAQFEIGEKVMVPHVDKLYEAKVLKSEIRENGQWHYYLHYLGWNKKYDEWAEELAMHKIKSDVPPQLPQPPQPPAPTTSSVEAAPQEAAPQQPQAKKARTSNSTKEKYTGGTSISTKEQDTGAGKKQSTSSDAARGAVASKAPCHLSLSVPPALKRLLLDDHAAVVEKGKLIPLPRSPSVSDLLQRYVQQSHDQRGSSVNEEEVAHGLRAYFDKSLEAVLLYRSEREHAQKALASGAVPSSVFGAEHLCRLFIKLPYLLTATKATEEQVENVGIMVQDVMLWMSDNIGTLFLPKDKYISSRS